MKLKLVNKIGSSFRLCGLGIRTGSEFGSDFYKFVYRHARVPFFVTYRLQRKIRNDEFKILMDFSHGF